MEKKVVKLLILLKFLEYFFYFSLLSTANDFYFHQNSPEMTWNFSWNDMGISHLETVLYRTQIIRVIIAKIADSNFNFF